MNLAVKESMEASFPKEFVTKDQFKESIFDNLNKIYKDLLDCPDPNAFENSVNFNLDLQMCL